MISLQSAHDGGCVDPLDQNAVPDATGAPDENAKQRETHHQKSARLRTYEALDTALDPQLGNRPVPTRAELHPQILLKRREERTEAAPPTMKLRILPP